MNLQWNQIKCSLNDIQLYLSQINPFLSCFSYVIRTHSVCSCRAQRRQSCWWVVPASAAKVGFRFWHTCTEVVQLCVDAASRCPDSVHGVSRMSSCSIASFRPTPTQSSCMLSTRGPEWVHIFKFSQTENVTWQFLEKMNICLSRDNCLACGFLLV